MNNANAAARFAVTFHGFDCAGLLPVPTVTDGGTVEVDPSLSDADLCKALHAAGTLHVPYGWEVGEWNGNLELYVGGNKVPAVTLSPL